MHHLAFYREVTSLPSHGTFPRRNPILPAIRTTFKTRRPTLNFRGTVLPEPPTLRISNCTAGERRLRVAGIKDIDIATFGNLCVDIVLNVPELPPEPPDQLKAYMDELSKTPPDKESWEAGGNSNVAIAASRLGLCCTTIGHVGDDVYGHFFLDVLHNEGISMVGVKEKGSTLDHPCLSCETLLCWVLVDPLQRHGFCSRTDFTEDPIYNWMTELSAEVNVAIKRSKILFCNGYDFDEFSPRLLQSALDCAMDARTSIFFDPGPRVTLLSGKPEEQRVFEMFLEMSDVLLLTSEEVALLTGIENPIRAGQELLKKGVHTRWVIVKMGAKGSILITTSSITCAPAFKVKVIDTVGCGDSFGAAIAYGFIHNAPLVHTLTLANAVGGATAMGCGAGRNVATLEQVIQLAKISNIDEDVKRWEELLTDIDLGALEVNLLSGLLINSQQLNIVPLQKVVSEILSSKLQPTQSTIALASSFHDGSKAQSHLLSSERKGMLLCNCMLHKKRHSVRHTMLILSKHRTYY